MLCSQRDMPIFSEQLETRPWTKVGGRLGRGLVYRRQLHHWLAFSDNAKSVVKDVMRIRTTHGSQYIPIYATSTM